MSNHQITGGKPRLLFPASCKTPAVLLIYTGKFSQSFFSVIEDS